jgi:hypothetical protein
MQIFYFLVTGLAMLTQVIIMKEGRIEQPGTCTSDKTREEVMLANLQNRKGNAMFNSGDQVRLYWNEEDAIVV